MTAINNQLTRKTKGEMFLNIQFYQNIISIIESPHILDNVLIIGISLGHVSVYVIRVCFQRMRACTHTIRFHDINFFGRPFQDSSAILNAIPLFVKSIEFEHENVQTLPENGLPELFSHLPVHVTSISN